MPEHNVYLAEKLASNHLAELREQGRVARLIAQSNPAKPAVFTLDLSGISGHLRQIGQVFQSRIMARVIPSH